MALEILVAGTGRCGTGWAAKVLTSAGVPCGHEAVFGLRVHGANGYRADSSWMAAAHLGHELLRGAKIVHIVREPLACIRSLAWTLYGKESQYTARARERIGGAPMKTPLAQAARHYVLWNEIIEPHAAVRVRAEDGPGALLSAVGVPVPPDVIDDRETNTRTPPSYARLTWQALPYKWQDRVREMGQRYGYPS